VSQDTGQLTPGLAETASAVRVGVASSAAASEERQREALAFIKENGGGARNHTPVTTDPRTKGG
jgi:hypothetical protein